MTRSRAWTAVDPFDLPEWIGTHEVTWTAGCALAQALVPGVLESHADGSRLVCDLLAADTAYPRPVVDEETRHEVHQAWQLGQVHLLEGDGRLALAVPTVALTADGVLEAVGRLAQAVGAPRDRFGVHLRAGR
ncbi:hypothetical protein [Nocardioides sp. YIM 152588]|uniref:hypothetical protein n=1 Tax=Nocardioides sp. YIM 152588 TaxID=3158259 RepID=UPI0032E433EE